MDTRRLEDKLDKIEVRLNSIDVTLGRQNVTLEEHVRRTVILETKIVPIERHVSMVNGGMKVLGVLAVLFEVLKYLGVLK